MDNSDRPSYLLWPIRGANGQFLLWSGNYFDLEAAKFVKPIGIEHFFDAFSLEKKRPLKIDAASALNIQVKDVSDSLVVNQDKAKRFELTPVWAPAEPPAKRAKTAEVRLSSASNVPRPPKSDENEKGSSEEEDSDSSGSNSDVSSQDDSSDVSDLEKFDEAYTDFGALTKNVDPRTLERDGSTSQNEEVPGTGGMKALHSLANVPKSWPLARLTIPLSAASKHLERLLEGCCNEIYVRNTNPDLQLHFVRKFAKDLVVVLAFHLAETIAALFRNVLHHPSKVLYDPETEPLFLPLFWFYPIYREMLNSASRHRPSKSMELRRAASGLVKVICRTEESRPNGRGKKPGKPKQKGLLASFEEWFGSINMMNILYVWFPASWGPSVVEAIQTRNVTCLAKKPIVRDPHIFDRKEAARGSRAREVTCRIQKWNIKAEGFHPILVANARVDWLAMDDDDITKKFPILLEGILQDVYSQRAASAWQGAQPQKLTVSMLLPGTSSAAEWRDLLQSRRQFWPTLTTRHASLVPVSVEACSVSDDRCKPSTFGTTWTLGGVTSRTSLKCLPPLDSPERIFGGISSSQSSARTPMRRAATLEKTWKMSNRNGRIRSITSSNTRRMSLALLALIWIQPFLALTLTTLRHCRQLKTQKLYMHVDGRPRKVRTVSRGEPCLMYETRLSKMIMQQPPAQMANRDGDAGRETMLWDISIIPNELDNGYLLLPPGVLHMSALGRFGRFTLFSPRVSHSKHLPVLCFVLCFWFGGVCCFLLFCFLFCKCLVSRILRAV